MKKLAAILFASFAFAAGVHAAAPAPQGAVSPASTAAVKDLLDAMRFRVSLKAGLDKLVGNAPAALIKQGEAAIAADAKLSDAQRKEKLAKLKQEVPRVQGAMQGVINDQSLYADIETELVPLFAGQFTVDEMKQMSAFYRTPAGAKALQVVPALMPQMMGISQRIAQPRIQKAIQQLKK